MSDLESCTKKPGRQINKLVIVGFCLATLIILLAVVFIPWDVAKPEAPDLELKQTPVPAAENAFTHFGAAEKLYVEVPKPAWCKTNWIWDGLARPIGSPDEQWDPDFADEILNANAAMLLELEKGLACSQCQYVGPLQDPATAIEPWKRSFDCGRLPNLLVLKAKRLHLAGDHAGACEVGLQQLHMGQMRTANANLLGEWYRGIFCQFFALRCWDELITDASTPESVLQKIRQELDGWSSQTAIDGFKTSLKGECRLTPAAINTHISERYPVTRVIPYLYKPNMAMRLMIAKCRQMLANADKPYAKVDMEYPGKLKSRLEIGDGLVILASPNSLGRFGFHEIEIYMDDNLLVRYSLEAQVAALRLKLALRQYEKKHGEFPDDLKILVPEWIKEIPRDPYDDQPFRYSKPEKKIWAVGCDLMDQGGKCGPEGIEFMHYHRLHNCDLVMQLGTREMKPTLAPKPQ